MKMMIRGWVKRKFIFPIFRALKQGISIERLSVSLALGITIGLIPLYGFTTLIVALIALSLRLNLIAMQAAHYIVHPLQLALLIPFLKLGDSLIRSTDLHMTVTQYIHAFKSDFWGSLHDLWLVNLSALVIWLIISIPLFLGLYYGLFYTIRKYFVRLRLQRA
jgi:uncharacterized protein (DUF2062 family)